MFVLTSIYYSIMKIGNLISRLLPRMVVIFCSKTFFLVRAIPWFDPLSPKNSVSNAWNLGASSTNFAIKYKVYYVVVLLEIFSVKIYWNFVMKRMGGKTETFLH